MRSDLRSGALSPNQEQLEQHQETTLKENQMKAVWRMDKTVLLAMSLAVVVIGFTASAAWAQGVPPVVWGDIAFQYDSGQAPSVAVSGSFIVEVHEGESGALLYDTGKIQENGAVTWAKTDVPYDTGYAPSIAISGNSIIEVHQASTSPGPLWYHAGSISSVVAGQITWAPSAQYDTGLAPSVAINGQTVIEVHQADSGVGPLWYRTAELGLNGAVGWNGSSFQYDTGAAPSVAIAGSTVIEVHQAGTNEGPLWYHDAEIQANGSVVWGGTPFEYDTGLAPSVSASGPTAVEVHQANSGVGALWYHTVALQSDGFVQFGAPFQYDSGEAPRIAVAGPTILEVHQAGTGSGLLYYHTAAY
jgi:hypothetical protein